MEPLSDAGLFVRAAYLEHGGTAKSAVCEVGQRTVGMGEGVSGDGGSYVEPPRQGQELGAVLSSVRGDAAQLLLIEQLAA